MKRLARILRLLNLPCVEIVHLVSQSLDRDLPWGDRMAIRMHMLYCTACCRFRRQMRLLREALHRYTERSELGEFAFPSSLSPEARRRIKRALGANG